MQLQELAKKLEGLQTIPTISKILNVDRRTAINYVWKLRKAGLVETSYGHRKIRMYKIMTLKKAEIGNKGLIEVINNYSKVNLILPYHHIVYGHKISVEEALVRAIKMGHFRTVLASLGLFNKVKNWHLLHNLAEKEKIGRKVGALYDVARQAIKVRKMDKRTRNAFLKSKVSSKFVITNFKSKDFTEIQNIWRVYIPFNRADLEVYKE